MAGVPAANQDLCLPECRAQPGQAAVLERFPEARVVAAHRASRHGWAPSTVRGSTRSGAYAFSGRPETRMIMTIEADSVRGMGAR